MNLTPEYNLRAADIFTERGVDVNAKRQDHCTPLHLASSRGRPDIAQVLLDHGAKVDAVDKLFRTTLHHASGGHYENQEDGVRVAQLLLKNGADVNAHDINRETPLHLAASLGRLEMARILLEHAIGKDDRGQNLSHLRLEGDYDAQIIICLTNTFS